MSSLLAERGPIHVNVGGTIVLEGKPPAFDDLLEHVDQRLNLVPRFRQKVTPLRLNIDNPVWTDDSAFDLRWHVRHTALPKPGSEAQLRELVGRVMSQPLDFARPLWQIYLVEGLEGERCAVISKTHHALVDGVSAVDVGTILLDPNKDGTEMEMPAEPWDPDEPSSEMLRVRAASGRVREPLRAARRAARTAVTMPRGTASRVMRTAESFAGLAARGRTPRGPSSIRRSGGTTGWTPPTINRVLAGALARPLAWNLVVSNVPGPQMPFYLLGRRVREVYPFVPLSPQGHALAIGVISCDGGVFFGLVGDRGRIADMDEVAADLEAALAEQLAAV